MKNILTQCLSVDGGFVALSKDMKEKRFFLAQEVYDGTRGLFTEAERLNLDFKSHDITIRIDITQRDGVKEG